MPAVQSSNVESFDFVARPDSEEGTLRVKFRSGRTYDYKNVSIETVSELEAALLDADASFGSAFNRIIRSAGYEYAEVFE